jgi:uncharacterized protein (DUF1778 family)
VLLGGVAIDEEEIPRLVAMLSGPLEKKLTQALLFRASVVALTREEKVAVLAALERAPSELSDIREALLSDDRWQLRRRL